MELPIYYQVVCPPLYGKMVFDRRRSKTGLPHVLFFNYAFSKSSASHVMKEQPIILQTLYESKVCYQEHVGQMCKPPAFHSPFATQSH